MIIDPFKSVAEAAPGPGPTLKILGPLYAPLLNYKIYFT